MIFLTISDDENMFFGFRSNLESKESSTHRAVKDSFLWIFSRKYLYLRNPSILSKKNRSDQSENMKKSMSLESYFEKSSVSTLIVTVTHEYYIAYFILCNFFHVWIQTSVCASECARVRLHTLHNRFKIGFLRDFHSFFICV